MASTQDFLPIQDIKDDVVIMKDGSMAMILQTSAVNFDLLSETEQMAIIGSFAGLLNSLSFSIQILIRSKRLDISHYLTILREAESHQKNPLLLLMMQHYRQFVTNIIRDNEVLDKQFYVVISVSYLEVGIVKDVEKNFQKALTILIPRRDHIMRQLGRIGLKSTQLNDERLTKLFYDFYNDSFKSSFGNITPQAEREKALAEKAAAQAPNIQMAPTPPPPPQPQAPLLQTNQTTPQMQTAQPLPTTNYQPQNTSLPSTPQPQMPESASQRAKESGVYQGRTAAAPFVVEELPDDYASV